MCLEDRDNVRRDGHRPAAGGCLGRAGEAFAARQLGHGLGDSYLAVQQVDAVPAQRRQFAEAEPAPGRHENHSPVRCRDRGRKSSTSATVATGCSCAGSFEAPLTSTGLRPMQPSRTAERMIVARRRYAFGAVAGSFDASARCQATTWLLVIADSW